MGCKLGLAEQFVHLFRLKKRRKLRKEVMLGLAKLVFYICVEELKTRTKIQVRRGSN